MITKTDWEKFVDYVNEMPEPSCNTFSAKMDQQGTHHTGKSYHTLDHYEMDLECPKPYRLVFSWASCPKCKEVRWRKVTAYNNKKNECFEKIYHKLID